MPHLDKVRTTGRLNAASRDSRFILLAVCALAAWSGCKPQLTNRPPEVGKITSQVETFRDYDAQGKLSGVRQTINLEVAATDPDGDILAYTWRASAGDLVATGNRAVWTGAKSGNEAFVSVSDGKGGSVEQGFVFKVE